MTKKTEQISERDLINFSTHVTPLPIEDITSTSSERFVPYGKFNDYPNFLLHLYNDSPLHKGIINKKNDLITGDGVTIKGSDTPVTFKPNPKDSFSEFVNKIISDYLIFASYAVEVVYNKLGSPIQYNHVPVHKIRANRDKSKFWYCNDWFRERNINTSYEYWKPGSNTDGFNKLFFFSSYSPSVNNVYPVPEYSGAIKSLETDIAIRDFQINNINNQFSVSSIITFFGGAVTDEAKRETVRKITNAYSGANGGKMIIGFEGKDGTAPDVKNIAPSEWEKAYIEVKADVTQDILTAHSVVSPELFAIPVPGKLGTGDLEIAYEITKVLYVKNRRNELESGLNKLFADAGLGELEFKDKGSLFEATLSDAMQMKTLTINEIREKSGLKPLLNGDRLIDEVKPVPTQEPTTVGQIPDNDISGSPVQATPVKPIPAPVSTTTKPTGFNSDATMNFGHLTDEDFDKVKHLGSGKAEFRVFKRLDYHIDKFSDLKAIELQFDDEKDIADWIVKNGVKNMTLVQIKAAIRKDLGINLTTSDLKKVIQGLEDSGVINKSDLDKSITIKPTEKSMQPALENIRRVEVRYSYEGPQDDKNRPFCAKLMANDKYYSREDIQQMSLLFGYDIFAYRGGFYHNPVSNQTTPYCRHRFNAVSVVRINPEGETE